MNVNPVNQYSKVLALRLTSTIRNMENKTLLIMTIKLLSLHLQIDSSAIVEMEIIESDESDYEVDFSGEPPSSTAETGTCNLLTKIPQNGSVWSEYSCKYRVGLVCNYRFDPL